MFNGRVVVGSNDGNVYCAGSQTGQKVWNFTTGDCVKSSPAIVNGLVYVGSYDGNMYCLNLSTGKKVWNSTASYYIHTSPAVGYSRVLYGSCDGFLYCVNASDGKSIWKFDSGGYVPSSPALSYGNVFFGNYNNRLHCVNATSGKGVWNFTAGDWIYSSPAAADDRIYFGSQDSNIYCLDSLSGKKLWNYTCEGKVDSSPAVDNTNVYVGSESNGLLCLNKTTGELAWKQSIGTVKSSPAVIDGRLLIAAGDTVYCLKDTNLASINISPENATVESGGTIQFVAAGYSASGEKLDGLRFNWSLSMGNLGTMSQDGLFKASDRDTDMDTVPDGPDPYPNDFNNDEIRDIDTHHDVDGDGVKDYPHGPDAYLNTTLPADFPSVYRARTISVRLSQEGLFYSPAVVKAWIGELSVETSVTVRIAAGSIIGRIVDRDDAPVVGAFAGTDSLFCDWTDGNGRFLIYGEKPGTVQLRVSGNGLETGMEVLVRDNKVTDVGEIRLSGHGWGNRELIGASVIAIGIGFAVVFVLLAWKWKKTERELNERNRKGFEKRRRKTSSEKR